MEAENKDRKSARVNFQENRKSAPGKRRFNQDIHDEPGCRNKIKEKQTPEKENSIFFSCSFVLFVVYSFLKIKPGKRKKTFRKEKIPQDLQDETG